LLAERRWLASAPGSSRRLGAQVAPSRLHNEGIISKLVVRLDSVQIKIEVAPVKRGCVFEPCRRCVDSGQEVDHLKVAYESHAADDHHWTQK